MLAVVLVLLLQCAPAVGSAVDVGACKVSAPHVGFDMPGGDLRQISEDAEPDMTTAEACGAACCKELLGKCVAFTFALAPSAFGSCVQGKHCCYLKQTVGAYKQSSLAGIASSTVSGTCSVDAPHVGFDMQGGDLSQISVVADPTMTSAERCGAACCKTSAPEPCVAFTFVVAPKAIGSCVQGKHCCFLKKTVGAYEKSSLADVASSTVSGRAKPPAPTVLWQYQGGAGGPSSPAISGGLVLVGGANHSVYAVHQANGSVAWKTAVGGPVQSSPAVANDAVYIGCSDGVLRALRLQDGAEIWNFTTGNYLQSSPAVAAGVVYIGGDDQFVYALASSSGQLLWKFKTGGPVDSSPMVSGGLVYIGSYDYSLYALNAMTGEKVWSVNSGAGIGSSPTVAGELVFFSSAAGVVYAADAKSGALRWNQSHFQSGNEAPPLTVAGGILFTSSQTGTHALNASTGEAVWSSPAPGRALSVAAGHVLVSGGDFAKSAFSLAAADGQIEWMQDYPESVYSSAAVDGDTVYLSTGDGLLFLPGGSLYSLSITASGLIPGGSAYSLGMTEIQSIVV